MEEETTKSGDRDPVKGGVLYLVATPIGNVGDISPRALEVLDSVDYIAAEDTRRAARLLSSTGVGNRLISYYEQNKQLRHDKLLADLEAGRSIALISDAGMPCISDPGEQLVRLAVQNGIKVSVIPGPSALLSALAAGVFGLQPLTAGGFFVSVPPWWAVSARARECALHLLPRRGGLRQVCAGFPCIVAASSSSMAEARKCASRPRIGAI